MCGLGSAMVSSSNLPAYISNDNLRTLSFSLSLSQCRRDRKVAGSQVDQPGLTSSANFLPKNLRRCFQGPQVFNFLITVKIIHLILLWVIFDYSSFRIPSPTTLTWSLGSRASFIFNPQGALSLHGHLRFSEPKMFCWTLTLTQENFPRRFLSTPPTASQRFVWETLEM